MSASQATGIQGAALAANDNDPTETVVVAISPMPSQQAGTRPISETTQHLLIAAGSIGAPNAILEGISADNARWNNSPRDDHHGRVHYAETRAHLVGSGQAWKKPDDSTWTPTSSKDLPK
jgi:hypothetical protein